MTDPHQINPDHHPTPFSADEIRDGCPPGRRTLVRRSDASGSESFTLTQFIRHENHGAYLSSAPADAQGNPIADAVENFSTWLELQAHASMPKAVTTVEETDVDLAIGEQKCLLYTVTTPESVTRFWFVRSLPGMPARVSEEKDGALTWTMEIVSDTELRRGE